MKNRAGLVLSLLCGLTAQAGQPGAAEEQLIPLETLFGEATGSLEPQVSADGTLVSYGSRRAGQSSIEVSHTQTPDQPVARFADPNNCIEKMIWVGGARWLAFLVRPDCSIREPHGPDPGHTVYAWNIVEDQLVRVMDPSPFRYAVHGSGLVPGVVAILRDKRHPRATIVETVNLDTGVRRSTGTPPGTTGIHLDRMLHPRLLTRRTQNGGFELALWASAESSQSLGDYANAERDGFRILGFSKKGDFATLIDTRDRRRAVIARIDLNTRRRTVLFEEGKWQPIDAVLDPTGTVLLAVQHHGHRKRWTVLDPKLQQVFDWFDEVQPAEVSIISKSDDRQAWVVAVDRDISPRRHYLLSRKRGTFVNLPGDDAALVEPSLSEKAAIEFRASDGALLTGYLTLPKAGDGPPFPLVQRVHGGPVLRHEWRFDPTAQWLANRGYAVLEVNFRGSGGFGAAFQRLGYGEWGRRMQQDLADGVAWAVRQGIAQRGSIGVMGHSYGGYAAVMGLIRHPELYACGVGISSPLDLTLFLQTLESFGSLATTASQKAFVSSQISRYRRELAAGLVDLEGVSPNSLWNRIKGPLLLVHGKRDRAVVSAHAEHLYKLLEGSGHPVALLEFQNEGHQIRQLEARLELNGVMERFFASCLGGRAKRSGQRPDSSNANFIMTHAFATFLDASLLPSRGTRRSQPDWKDSSGAMR